MGTTRNWYVYVLRSLSDGKRYTGLSRDVHSRLRQHNARKVRSTKSRGPFTLIHQEQCGSLKHAREREKYLKSDPGRRWLDKVEKVQNVAQSSSTKHLLHLPVGGGTAG